MNAKQRDTFQRGETEFLKSFQRNNKREKLIHYGFSKIQLLSLYTHGDNHTFSLSQPCIQYVEMIIYYTINIKYMHIHTDPLHPYILDIGEHNKKKETKITMITFFCNNWKKSRVS